MRRQDVANKFSVTKEGVEYEFEAVKEGGYVVTMPLYVSCATQGDTFEEALSNIEDALFECLSAARDLNLLKIHQNKLPVIISKCLATLGLNSNQVFGITLKDTEPGTERLIIKRAAIEWL